MGFSAASSCVRLMDSRMLSSSPMDCRIVHARDHEQEGEVGHEVRLPGHEQRRAHEDGGADAQLEERLRRGDEHAGGQFGRHLPALERVELGRERVQMRRRAVRGADLLRALQELLHAVGHLEARVLHRLRLALLVLPGERHHEQRRGHHPERRERQTPVVEEDADDDDGRGQARAEQLRHDVHEHALLVGAVLHDGVREVGQVAPPEERQRQPAQVLGQVGALAGALLVHLVVRVRVLGPLGEDHEREDADAPREVRRQRGQRGPRHEVVHEVAHQQEQDADRGHEHEVRQRAEEHAAPEVLRAHVGEAQGITQHSRPPFRCAIAPRFDSRPTCARTSRPPPPARRGSPAPRGGRRPARRWRRRRPRWTAGARS